MLSRKRKLARLAGKHQAHKDAGNLVLLLTGSNVLGFSYLSNKYTSDMVREEYRNALNDLAFKLLNRSEKLFTQLSEEYRKDDNGR